MISTRRLVFLGAALLISGGAVFLTQQWLQGEVSRAATAAEASSAGVAGTRVLVAGEALPAGTILKPQNLRWQAWPADGAVGYFSAADATPEQLAGSVVRTDLRPGEPLTATRVVKPGERGFLAAVLRPGHRAVTVNVSASTGVAGFALPGDRVDLILSRTIGPMGPEKRMVSETVLSNLRVLATDQRSTAGEDVVVPQTATLEVTPRQAEVVALTSELGKLSLSLRSLATPEDAPLPDGLVTRTWDYEVTQTPLSRPRLPSAAPVRTAAPAAQTPARATVQVVRGSAVAPEGIAR